MTIPTLLRRVLLPGLLLVGLIAVLAWEPPHSSQLWQAQVTSGSGSSVYSEPSSSSVSASSVAETVSSSASGSSVSTSEASSSLSSASAASSVPVTGSSSAASVASSMSSPISSSASQGTSSSALSTNGTVIGLEAGLCAQVKPDPATGEKLVYCCIDEGLLYQQEGTEEELKKFMSLLEAIETMTSKEAKVIFEAPYDGSLHQKYGWTTLCGKQIPCEVCSQDHICGNGIVEDTEKCDDGPRNSDETPDTCRADCTLPACGDGVVDRLKGEKCDDGGSNTNQPNRCRTNCELPACGDSIIDTLSGETCDSGTQNSDTEPNRCRTDCQSPRCGDGVKDSNEECDDGNRGANDGCSFSCEIEGKQSSSSGVLPPALQCGNGIVEPGEECDDGIRNANVPNACRQNCALPRCGDRIQDDREECDDGNTQNGDGCTAFCTRELVLSLTNVCGNRLIDPGEECDAGSANANVPDHCRFDCRFPICGDGIRDTNEQCDDGNTQDGDGCTRDCFSEFCGDGILEMGEECDDGNLISGDGCNRQCQKDTGTPVAALVVAVGSSRASLHAAASSQAVSAAQQLSSPTAQRSSAASPAHTQPIVAAGTSSRTSAPSTGASSAALQTSSLSSLSAQVIPFQTTATEQSFPTSTYYYPQQLTYTYTSPSLNDTGPAALSIVAMGAAAGLAWARRKRRN